MTIMAFDLLAGPRSTTSPGQGSVRRRCPRCRERSTSGQKSGSHLRVVASDGWAFECVTPWSARFVQEHQKMFLTRWDKSKRTIVPAGGKTAVAKTFNLKATWVMLCSVNPQTGEAIAAKGALDGGIRRSRPRRPRPAGRTGSSRSCHTAT